MYRFLPATLLLVCAQGCLLAIQIEQGNGDIVDETRDVGAFTEVHSAGSLSVSVVAGDAPSVVVSCDSNLLERIETRVEDGTLVIDQRGSLLPSDGCCVHVVAVDLSGVVLDGSGAVDVDFATLGSARIAGSGALTVHGPVTTDHFDASNAGSGRLEVGELDVASLDVDSSGSGAIDVAAGVAGSLLVDQSGSGSVDTVGLSAEDVVVSVSGSGNADVTATLSVQATLDGSGNITVHGDPAERDVDESGSGRITFE